MIIDTKLYNPDAENRAWLLSKTKRISPNGICVATFTQDKFDQHKDYIEKDEDGNIIGMWADYWVSSISPQAEDDSSPLFSSITSKITTSGNSTQIRVGGSKTFTVSFTQDDEPVTDHEPGTWSFTIDGEDATEIITSVTYPADNKVKIKIKDSDDLIGKILSVTNTSSGDIVSSFDVEIIAL